MSTHPEACDRPCKLLINVCSVVLSYSRHNLLLSDLFLYRTNNIKFEFKLNNKRKILTNIVDYLSVREFILNLFPHLGAFFEGLGDFVGGRSRLIILLELGLRSERVILDLRIELLSLFLEDLRHALATRFVLIWSRDVFLLTYNRFSDGYLQFFVSICAQDPFRFRFLMIVAGPGDVPLRLSNLIKQ